MNFMWQSYDGRLSPFFFCLLKKTPNNLKNILYIKKID